MQNFSILSPEDEQTIDLEAVSPRLCQSTACSSPSWVRGGSDSFIFIDRHPRASAVTAVVESVGIG